MNNQCIEVTEENKQNQDADAGGGVFCLIVDDAFKDNEGEKSLAEQRKAEELDLKNPYDSEHPNSKPSEELFDQQINDFLTEFE